MAACRSLTPEGARFFALTLYFQHVADRRGMRLHVWRILKAWPTGQMHDIEVKIQSIQEE